MSPWTYPVFLVERSGIDTLMVSIDYFCTHINNVQGINVLGVY